MTKSEFRECDIYAARIAALRPFPKETLKSLRECYRVGLTYTSNALEGNSLTETQKGYEWAEKIRDAETCVVSGFQSPLEKDVLKFLLRGRVPIILVLARSLWKTVPEELRAPVGLGRLLIVSPVSATRASTATATARNRWILANCTSLVLGSLDPGGSLARLVAMFPVANMICLQVEARGPAPIG